MDERLAGICRKAVEPLDGLYGGRKLIVIGDGKEGWWCRVSQVIPPIQVRISGEQHQRFHLGTAARGLNGVVHSATRAPHANHVARHPRLRHQVLKGDIDVAGPLFPDHLSRLLRRHLVEALAATLSKATHIQRENVDSRACELLGQAVPNLALAVALMQQKYSGAGFGSGKESGFKLGPITGGQVHDALSRPSQGATGNYEQERSEYGGRETLALHGD